jgi:hypothetical protein
MLWRALSISLLAAASAVAQQAQPAPDAATPGGTSAPSSPAPQAEPALSARPDADAAQAAPKVFEVKTNTRIPLSMINSVSTKNAAPGDSVYLETVFPILVDGHIVIPPGSYVSGTITKVQRPGKLKGRGEFYLRFDTLTLPNGVTRDFRARVSGLDGRASEELDRNEGSIKSEGTKGKDAGTVVETTVAGASIGALAGSAAGATGMGAGIGAAAGAAAGLATVLFSRGPDAVLAKGTTVEMVLDRNVDFTENEINFAGAPPRTNVGEGSGPLPSHNSQGPFHRFPL